MLGEIICAGLCVSVSAASPPPPPSSTSWTRSKKAKAVELSCHRSGEARENWRLEGGHNHPGLALAVSATWVWVPDSDSSRAPPPPPQIPQAVFKAPSFPSLRPHSGICRLMLTEVPQTIPSVLMGRLRPARGREHCQRGYAGQAS